MNVLFLGDVVGQPACDKIRRDLPKLRSEFEIGLVIANGENSAQGNGITPHSAEHLFASGVDVITTGNHALRRREIYPEFEKGSGLIHPANFHENAPGTGVYLYDHPQFPVCVINLQGRVYLETYYSPFDVADQLLKEVHCPNIIVDFHAEATAEKIALAHYLDGRVSAVIGTHTHVATADERLLPNGTAYITDAGMCGGRNSCLGVHVRQAIEKMRTGLPGRFSEDPEQIELHGVLLRFGNMAGKVQSIERVFVGE